jgi:hypothetical protein
VHLRRDSTEHSSEALLSAQRNRRRGRQTERGDRKRDREERGKINREGRKREEKGDRTEKRQRQREERRKKAAITFRTATTVMAGPGARSVLLPPSRYTSPLDAATAAWSLRGSRKVEFTDLIQNSQVDPAVRLKIPIRALEVTQILGQPCEVEVAALSGSPAHTRAAASEGGA